MSQSEEQINEIELSIIVPVFNEEESIAIFYKKLFPILESCSKSFEVLFIDDGSSDNTESCIEALVKSNPLQVSLLTLSRNFGKDIALTAGLQHSRGQAVIPIDVDLQDPPELIPEMLVHWRKGVKMVVPTRTERQGDSWLKRTTASIFYRLLKAISHVEIPPNAGDFRLIDREIVDIINSMPEKARFMKGLFSWPGYSTCFIPYERDARQAGTTKWNYWKLWNFALDGIFSFSTAPLRIWTYLGMACGGMAVAYALFFIFKTMILGNDVDGYPSLIVAIMFLGGINLMGIGVLGEYIGRIFEESKKRPLYLVKNKSKHLANRTGNTDQA